MDPAPEAPVPAKLPLKERLKALLEEYGRVALVLYFVIFGLVFAGFAIAIGTGMDAEGAGLIGGAWVATKLTQPIRTGAPLVLTPFTARAVTALRRRA
jgi:hypothetical protein